ncbi:Protein abci12 [Ranunculus cassubicifolius]
MRSAAVAAAVHISTIPTLLYFPPNSSHKTLIPLKLQSSFTSFTSISTPLSPYPKPLNKLKKLQQIRSSSTNNNNNNGETSNKWLNWIPKGVFAEKIFRLISTATSSPISQFVSSPTTFLHSVDPRIKLVWLLALVVLPARSHIIMRFGLVGYLALLSIWILPRELWMDQLARVGLLSGILFIMLGFGTDGVPPLVQTRTPPPSMMGLTSVPTSLAGYSYVVIKLGPLQLTRKGLSVASTSACLTFTIFQSASLCLSTTTPEQLASAIRWFMLPLTRFGVPVSEIILTLLLSLRFISLVFDEVRNAALGIVARRINWQNLTVLETVDLFFMYVRRIFKNIFTHAEHISQAMIVRGFRGDSNNHKIYLLSKSSIGWEDIISLLCLLGLIGAAVLSEVVLV